ncbi:hypothetical protein BpHYR1_008675 [Brachionus plicatilis]|uniref:Uncharacterized protein n=1 Tax=Brachionus plicatilis TaxID=10195 RepID=A0A3M7QHA5_BRAPC|nr:hypothetical protein BpHYR1_008675 [Brachionus plicatilis]
MYHPLKLVHKSLKNCWAITKYFLLLLKGVYNLDQFKEFECTNLLKLLSKIKKLKKNGSKQ